MRNLVTAVLMLLASVVAADGVSLGYYGEIGSYDAGNVSASIDDFSLYLEHSGGWDYTLVLVDVEVDEGLRIGMRFDSPSIWRPYVKKSLDLGGGGVTVRWTVGGLGDGKNRFDLFAGYPINDWLSIEGWERYQSTGGGRKSATRTSRSGTASTFMAALTMRSWPTTRYLPGRDGEN